MNSNENRFDPEQEEFIARLARVPAIEVSIDPQLVFYKAGFAAAEAEQKVQMRRIGILMSAASFIGLCVVATFAYQAGAAMAPQAIASTSVPSDKHSSHASNTESRVVIDHASSTEASSLEATDVEQPTDGGHWSSDWGLSQRRAASSGLWSDLGDQRPMSLVGLGAPRPAQWKSIKFGTPNQSSQPSESVDSARHDTRPPLHPRDWKSLLPAL